MPRVDKQRQRRLRRANLARNTAANRRPDVAERLDVLGDVQMDSPEGQHRLDLLVDTFARTIEEGDGTDADLDEMFRDWLRKIKAGDIGSLRALSVEDQVVAVPLIQISSNYRAWSRLGPSVREYLTRILADVGLQPPADPSEEDVADNEWHDWLVSQIRRNKERVEREAQEQRVTRRRADRALRQADPSWSVTQRKTWDTFWTLVDYPDQFERLSDRSKTQVVEILSDVGFSTEGTNPAIERFNDELARRHTTQGHPQSWVSRGRALHELGTLGKSLEILASERGNFEEMGRLMAEYPLLTDEHLAALYNEQHPGADVSEAAIKYVRERYGPDGLPQPRLPNGMKVGDPIYGNDKLIGHVNERGDFINLITPENEEFKVPVVLDGPWAKELLAEADLTPDKEVSIRIGGPSPKRLAPGDAPTPVTYRPPERQPDERLFHDRDQSRHMLGVGSLGQFTVTDGVAGVRRLSFEVLVDGDPVTLETRDAEIVNTLLADREAGQTLAESICQLAERLSDADERYFFYRESNGDPIARAIAEASGQVPKANYAARSVSLQQIAVAVTKARYDETYQKNERELGKLAAEWTTAGGSLEDFSRAMAEGQNARAVSVSQLERLKQDYLLSGQGIREAVGEPVEFGACDFCDGSAPAAWIYPAESFTMQTPAGTAWEGNSDGAWAACAQCAALIEADDRLGLASRYLASKPQHFHDVLRPWVIRLHNQFVRHRTGNRFRYERPVLPASGGIEVMSAETAEQMGYHDLAARVRNSGDMVMTVDDGSGSPQVIAEGSKQVDMRLERRTLANGYQNHPLIVRLTKYIRHAEATQGVWHSTEPWQVLAEKYSMTVSAAASLGLGLNDPGSMYFDPMLLSAGLQDNPEYADELGLSIARSLHDAVPYLWLQKVDELAAEGELPAHTITRGLLPDPVMYWSFEDALGEPTARIDWMLIRETPLGYEVWCPQADDVRRPGTIMITGMLLGYGRRWPDDFRGPSADLAEWMLKRLSFVNSKYVDVPKVVAHRSVRRDVERQIKPGMVKPPEDLAAYVVHLRERAQPLVIGGEPGDGPGREYKHHWWRRAHRRVLYRDTDRERVTWVARHLVGDPNLPLIRNKVKVVSR